jgi:hypothetical protein
MGCAIFPEEKHIATQFQQARGNKKTNKIDTRKRSSQTLDLIVENISVLESKLTE